MEKNELTKKIKNKLKEHGLGFMHVTGGKGSAWGWIDISSDNDLTEDQQNLFNDLFGADINRSGYMCDTLDCWESKLGYSNSRELIHSPEYFALKKKYYETAYLQEDNGTCCLGSGTYILKDGVKIDFWSNHYAQSDFPAVKTARIMVEDFAKLNLTTLDECGNMD